MNKEQMRAQLGALIQKEREARGWSRYKLAHEAGIQETHLANIEGAKYSIRVDILDRLCRALEIEVTIPLDE